MRTQLVTVVAAVTLTTSCSSSRDAEVVKRSCPNSNASQLLSEARVPSDFVQLGVQLKMTTAICALDMASEFQLRATTTGLTALVQQMGIDQSKARSTIGSADYWVQDLIKTASFGSLYRELEIRESPAPGEFTGVLKLFTT